MPAGFVAQLFPLSVFAVLPKSWKGNVQLGVYPADHAPRRRKTLNSDLPLLVEDSWPIHWGSMRQQRDWSASETQGGYQLIDEAAQ